MNSTIEVKNELLEKEIVEFGYTTCTLLSEQQILELRTICKRHFTPSLINSKYNYDSNADTDVVTKRFISNEIQRIVKPSIDKMFENYEFIPSIFFIKHPSETDHSAVPMHNDPTLLIDETEKTHIKIWCPLQNVDESNGAMHFIKGSHRFVPPVNAVTLPSHYENVYNQLHKYTTCIPLKAGEAVMFDNRTLHESSPNRSDSIRLTAIISIIAPNRQFISLYKDAAVKNSPIEVYFQDKDWYYHPEWHNQHKRPQTGILKGYLDYAVFQVSSNQLKDLAANPRSLKSYVYSIKSIQQGFLHKFKSLFLS
jgi:hypothetical protein